jgi:hypothetical protein
MTHNHLVLNQMKLLKQIETYHPKTAPHVPQYVVGGSAARKLLLTPTRWLL